MYTEDEFWRWFAKNEHLYRNLNEIEGCSRYEELLDDFLLELQRFSPGIYFLIGQLDEKMELIITAEGNPIFFEPVEKIVTKAPAIAGWNFIAFKPAVNESFVTNFEGAVIDTSNSWFRYFKTSSPGESRGNICIYTNNYTSNGRNNFLAAGCTVLDSLLGEKMNASCINQVDVQAMPLSSNYSGLMPLAELRNYLAQLHG